MQGATLFCHPGTSNRIHDRKQTMGNALSIYSPLAAYSPQTLTGAWLLRPHSEAIHVTLPPFGKLKVETVDLVRNNVPL